MSRGKVLCWIVAAASLGCGQGPTVQPPIEDAGISPDVDGTTPPDARSPDGGPALLPLGRPSFAMLSAYKEFPAFNTLDDFASLGASSLGNCADVTSNIREISFAGYTQRLRVRKADGTCLIPTLESSARAFRDAVKSIGAINGKVGTQFRGRAAGVVYGSLGWVDSLYQDDQGAPNEGTPNSELAYNALIYSLAAKYKAPLWMQLRIFDNELTRPDATSLTPTRNYTAAEILANFEGSGASFRSKVREIVTQYATQAPGECTIVVGEEETPYHERFGSGMFWAGRELFNARAGASASTCADLPPEGLATCAQIGASRAAKYLKNIKTDPTVNNLFAVNVAGIYNLIRNEIGSIEASTQQVCRVGFHVGHIPLEDAAATAQVNGDSPFIAATKQMTVKPDFVFYDLYLKASATRAIHYAKLQERTEYLRSHGLEMLYLAQLHSMNNFQNGLGRTPSDDQIQEMSERSRGLGHAGFGFYTKQVLPTFCGYRKTATQDVRLLDDPNYFVPALDGDLVTFPDPSDTTPPIRTTNCLAHNQAIPAGAQQDEAIKACVRAHTVCDDSVAGEDRYPSDPTSRVSAQSIVFETTPLRWQSGLKAMCNFTLATTASSACATP
jgi:hypothetical protein